MDDENHNDVCCKNCRFFNPDMQFCMRFPPTIVMDYNEKTKKKLINSKYPYIHRPSVDWCGEFDAYLYDDGDDDEPNGNLLID